MFKTTLLKTFVRRNEWRRSISQRARRSEWSEVQCRRWLSRARLETLGFWTTSS